MIVRDVTGEPIGVLFKRLTIEKEEGGLVGARVRSSKDSAWVEHEEVNKG